MAIAARTIVLTVRSRAGISIRSTNGTCCGGIHETSTAMMPKTPQTSNGLEKERHAGQKTMPERREPNRGDRQRRDVEQHRTSQEGERRAMVIPERDECIEIARGLAGIDRGNIGDERELHEEAERRQGSSPQRRTSGPGAARPGARGLPTTERMSTTHPEPDAKTGVYRWRQTQQKRRTALTAGAEERENEDEERKTECAVGIARSHQA